MGRPLPPRRSTRRALLCAAACVLCLASQGLTWHHRRIPSGIFNDASAFHVWCPERPVIHFRAHRRLPLVRVIGALKLYGGTSGSEPVRLYARARHRAAVHDLAPYWSIQNERGGPLLVRWYCLR